MVYENNGGNDQYKSGKASASTEQNQNSGDDMYMTDISDEATLQPYPESQAVSDPNWALMAYNLRIIMENSPLDTYKNITQKRPRCALPETRLRHISPLRSRHEYAQVELKFHLNEPNTTVAVDTGCSDMLVDEGWLKTLSPNAQLFTPDKPNVINAMDGPVSQTK